MLVSNEIRKLREKVLMTQEEFAQKIGVAASTVNRWETNKTRPNMSAMKSIKAFCESNNYPYERIEIVWLSRI
ncbi:helix-turn-helix domain-containing protein [Holdemanella porci]|uniref:helix-turn-helix domain-containing protein n=1 Tax=Holdemanella porci TaxID=2652276 RepID=UPI00388FFEFC